ncbi:xanthine dehydrogenase small subunit [Acetobacter lambici]|uniref:Xanthine dehydrogenase small subunit n=1 Tax=Acetobacter lambici TaxID=1332824 RepID=A0ABT1EZ54_9PROT|nr:xanthine dehydrogenase small subunit [Acetobacter lambici]MCP1242213.1 xanthine dehydrogenase small subunit [Acetobacter lambici]MCP1258230.1 xanthine dehydrogenase small subunit [Acetobacter lambici]NHO56749.1 xanthine dehydrogenase small subunit [Acetobacter lambici]
MRQHISFYVGDTLHTLSNLPPEMTLLDWLRDQQNRAGTKEGCNEGDCGACTVLVGRLEQGALVWRAVNACIHMVWMLDGAQLLTVEDVRGADGQLHPVQQAMVDEHGSQCGFCTPGFVMSMVALSTRADLAELEGTLDGERIINEALAGNLCRCTGYAPIVRAMKKAAAYCAEHGEPISARTPELTARLRGLQDGKTVELRSPEGRVTLPASVDALASAYAQDPAAVLVAGGTDVGLWVTKRLRQLPHIIAVRTAQDLHKVHTRPDGALWIGAGVTYTEAMPHLVAHLPAAADTLRRIGSTQVRNAATVCGNIGNASPIGDGPPIFMAAGAQLHLRCGPEHRVVPLEAFFLEYGKQDIRPGEFIEGVLIPPLAQGSVCGVYKVSKRFDQDISAVLGAFVLLLAEDGTIEQARLAYGGMAGIPCRAKKAEAALVGQARTQATLLAAQAAIKEDFTPLSDMRASAWYRATVAANLLARLFDTGATGNPSNSQTLENWQEVAHG